MAPELLRLLERLRDIPYDAPFSLGAHSTVGVGGDASVAFRPRGAGQIVRCVRAAEQEKVPYFLLGFGSNVLPADAGFRGAIIRTVHAGRMVLRGGRLFAECGAPVAAMLSLAAAHGRGGLAFLAGIPATVGGALFMNAGARGCYIGGAAESVTVYEKGEVRCLRAGECRFDYKDTRFMHEGSVILSATFRTEADERAGEAIAAALAARASLPRERSMGCVFKNPCGASAGELIERAGLKGLRIGGARVSEKHANFIVNCGGATAADFCRVIAAVREKVFSETGIVLEEEIRYIGDQYASDG